MRLLARLPRAIVFIALTVAFTVAGEIALSPSDDAEIALAFTSLIVAGVVTHLIPRRDLSEQLPFDRRNPHDPRVFYAELFKPAKKENRNYLTPLPVRKPIPQAETALLKPKQKWIGDTYSAVTVKNELTRIQESGGGLDVFDKHRNEVYRHLTAQEKKLIEMSIDAEITKQTVDEVVIVLNQLLKERENEQRRSLG